MRLLVPALVHYEYLLVEVHINVHAYYVHVYIRTSGHVHILAHSCLLIVYHIIYESEVHVLMYIHTYVRISKDTDIFMSIIMLNNPLNPLIYVNPICPHDILICGRLIRIYCIFTCMH